LISAVYDYALSRLNELRRRVDEAILLHVIKNVEARWVKKPPAQLEYYPDVCGIDSGYNYAEFRGYALYIVDAVLSAVDRYGSEWFDYEVDVDVVGSTTLESDLTYISTHLEMSLAARNTARCSYILFDGGLLAKYIRLSKAAAEGVGVNRYSPARTLREFLYMIGAHPKKVVFFSKNSSAKDLLGMVKGDVYYIERLTEGATGFTKPFNLESSKMRGVSALASRFREELKNVSGVSLHPYVVYARFDSFKRVYRLEFVAEGDEDANETANRLFKAISAVSVSGYPYQLMRADQLARIGDRDVEKLASILGLSSEPRGREPLEVFAFVRRR